MARSARLGVAIAVLAAALGAPARAGEENGEADLRLRAASTAAAARISAFGNWCRGRSYKALAREQYEEALRLDPEDAAARAGLGHRREESGWKAPEGRPPLLDAPTTSASSASLLEKEAATAWAGAGEEFAALARWCAGSGLAAEARAAWEKALRFDPGHAGARAALGLERIDAGWTRPSEEGPAALDARLRKAAEEGHRTFREAGGAGREQGTGWTEAREARFSARSTSAAAFAWDIVGDMVLAEDLWRGAGVLKGRAEKLLKFRFEAMATKAEFVERIDGLKDRDGKWKESRKALGGCWIGSGTFVSWGKREERQRETATHYATHFLLDRLVPGDAQAWLEEGPAIYAVTLLRGRATSFCVAVSESATERDGPEAMDWNEEARLQIRRGEDPPMGEFIAARTNDLGLPLLVKARSMVAWMAGRAPGAFRAALEGSAEGVPPGEVLYRAFGAPPDAIERRWRYWARRP